MDTAQKAGIALVFLILLKVLVYMVRFYRLQKQRYPPASVILVVGGHLSRKPAIVRKTSLRAFPCIFRFHICNPNSATLRVFS